MIARVQEWIDAVEVFVKKGMTLEETEKNFTFRDRYPMQPGRDDRAPMLRKATSHGYTKSWKTGRNKFIYFEKLYPD